VSRAVEGQGHCLQVARLALADEPGARRVPRDGDGDAAEEKPRDSGRRLSQATAALASSEPSIATRMRTLRLLSTARRVGRAYINARDVQGRLRSQRSLLVTHE
jgi:hypothetical protein